MEDNAAPQPGTPVLEPEVVERLVCSAARVTPYVSLTGQAVTHPSVYERDIAAVRRARTMAGVVDGLNRCRARWAEMGVAKEVRYTLEPFADGEPGDVHVRLHVEEARPKKEVGVFTTDTAVPELRASLRNILGRAYDVSLHYVPSSSKMQSGALTLTSFVPWVGQRCEYYVGRRTENELSGVRPIPVADSENVTEAKVAVDLVGGEGSPSPWLVKFALGMQRRLLLASDAEAWPQDFGASTKCYLRWAVRHTAAGHHTHPRLAALYGLPVSGHVASAVTEVAGGPMPGEASHVRSELQATKFVSLLPGLTLDLSAMAGVAFPLTFGRAVAADAAPSVLLPDRLFLTWRHIRGYRSLGPSNVTDAAEQGLPPPRRFRPTGGNASWALGATLNFPLPIAPENGFVGGHLFANAGNLGRFSTPKEAAASWRDFFTRPAASIGAGLVVTGFPMFSPLNAGRFELTWALPVTVGGGGVSFAPLDANLWRTFRWGLHWTNAAQ